jgi:glutaredoxin
MAHKVHLFALTTCSHCRSAKAYLDERQVPYSHVDVDLTTGEERKAVLEEVKKYNAELSFPTIVIDDRTVIVGFRKDELDQALK